MFELHPRLARDTFVIGDFPLSRLLLMNDASYPWFILVPRRADIVEIFELRHDDQLQLLKESSQLSMVLSRIFEADKLNIAALGNMVPQLHVHVIARFETDRAWPGPIWGVQPPAPYGEESLKQRLLCLREALARGPG